MKIACLPFYSVKWVCCFPATPSFTFTRFHTFTPVSCPVQPVLSWRTLSSFTLTGGRCFLMAVGGVWAGQNDLFLYLHFSPACVGILTGLPATKLLFFICFWFSPFILLSIYTAIITAKFMITLNLKLSISVCTKSKSNKFLTLCQ